MNYKTTDLPVIDTIYMRKESVNYKYKKIFLVLFMERMGWVGIEEITNNRLQIC